MVSLKSSATTVEHQPEQQASFCTLLILPEHESPGWLLTLITMLQPAYIIDTIIQSQPILPDQLPDVCIAAELTDTVLNLFESLEHQTTIAPLRVLVTEDFDHPALNTCVDMVFPPIPRYINHQLPKVLHAHKERIHLQGQILALTRAVQLLQNKLAIEKKSVEELVLLKNAIVRNVSHELRTPLLQVKSAVSLLAEEAPGSTLAGYAQDSTARLEAVVKNIAQLADSIDDMNISVMLVRECAEYAVLNLRRLWRHKDDIERIQLQIPDRITPVMGDKQAISTVLQLLVDNALKFSESKVIVSAQSMGSHVRLAVTDYGIGIPEEQREAIFQTFYQVDNSSTRRYGGIGVGLAIVQLILERHNVQISVQSKVGVGSTFSFMLPAASI